MPSMVVFVGCAKSESLPSPNTSYLRLMRGLQGPRSGRLRRLSRTPFRPYLAEYFQWLAERVDERLKNNPREPFYKQNLPSKKHDHR